MDREACLKSALTHLRDALGLFVDAQMPGAQPASKEVILRAAQLTAEAHLQFEHLLAPPNPYADPNLRPGLGYGVANEHIPSNPIKGDDHA